jgi:uncharacterized protein
MEAFVGLFLLGIAVGGCGTLIGAGGGFLLMPIMLLIYPGDAPEALTAISLAVIFFNALSGTVAYARMKRIDYASGLLFAAAGVPGAIAGAMSTELINRKVFNGVFGVFLVAIALFLLFSRYQTAATPVSNGESGRPLVPPYNRKLGAGASFGIGVLSSLLGIGGGIIHVPFMARVLRFPVHVATATSHFVLCILALVGASVHLIDGRLAHEGSRVVPLALGVILGAQGGAVLSNYVHGKWILWFLAMALASVGVRILLAAF